MRPHEVKARIGLLQKLENGTAKSILDLDKKMSHWTAEIIDKTRARKEWLIDSYRRERHLLEAELTNRRV
jgi:hypothetical protein